MPTIALPAMPEGWQLLADVGRGLGVSPSAFAILGALAAGPRSQGELERELKVGAMTLSRHLRAMEAVGFVTASLPLDARRGRAKCVWTLERATVSDWLDAVKARVSSGGG